LQQLAQLQRELEIRASDANKDASVSQLRLVIMRSMKGQMAMRLLVWHTLTKEACHETRLADMKESLEKRADDVSKTAGINQLRLCMLRMTKGKKAVSLAVWMQNLKVHVAQMHEELMHLQTLQSMTASQHAAMRMMLTFTKQRLKDEVVKRLQNWQQRQRFEWTLKRGALQRVKQIMLQRMKGDLAYCLERIRANRSNEDKGRMEKEYSMLIKMYNTHRKPR